MQKNAPSIPRILAMVIFALATIGVLMFLWISFGGPIPLAPKRYELKVDFPEATTLAEEADVRIAGVTVGKVRRKTLDKRGAATTATLDIDPQYAPIPRDTKAILRQKTLLGETYVELTPGNRRGPSLPDGATLPRTQVEPTVELDEILRIFDPDTKKAFRAWVAESAQNISGTGGQDLNYALGNLAEFANSGAGVLSVLNTQHDAVQRLVRNTGEVFAALNQRYGQLHDLIVNSGHTFSATAAEKNALAETFSIFPVFLDESRSTLNRLSAFAINTRPLVNLLKPVADQLGPTLTDLGNVGPPLERLFNNLKPVIAASGRDLPQGARFLKGAVPLFHGLHQFLPELNPVLSFLNYQQNPTAHFLTGAAASTHSQPFGPGPGGVPRYVLPFNGAIDGNSFGFQPGSKDRPQWDRGTAYFAPNMYQRAVPLGIDETFDCRPDHPNGNGTTDHVGRLNPVDQSAMPGGIQLPPCFVQPPQLYKHQRFVRLNRGDAPLVQPPFGLQGNVPATP